MSCQFHPTISDSKPASPTAVLLHLYYLHDPRLGLPRPHHAFPGDIGPPPWLDDDCDSDMDESYDDDELWCCGPGLYVAYECVRLWVEPDTAVRELCEHLEDVVSWPIDDMGVQVWHADSKLHPTHTFAQLGWFRQLAPATSASPPSSPYDRLVLCLPADPCVCTHCCRIDFARAKRRVKLVRRHIEQHYQEVVLAEEEEEEEEARRRDGRSNGAGGKGKRGGVGGGGSIEEDDSWMDEVDDSGKGSMEKSASKGQKGKAAGAKKVKSKLSKEAQRLLKKEKEAKEEKERKAREQKEKEEQARQERAKRDAEALAEQERAEREKEAARRQLREQQQRQREEAEKDVRWQKEWAEWAEEETKVGPPGGPPTVATVAATKVVTTAAASTVKTKQASSKAAIDKQESSSNKSKSTAASGKPQTSPKQQSQKKAQRHAKATADSTNPPSPVTNHTAVQQHTTAVHSEPHQSNTPTSTTQHATATHIYTHQPQQQHQSKRQWKKTAVDNCTQTHDSTPPLSHPSTSSALPDHPTATVKPAAVPAVAAVVAPTKWKGWGSPRTASLCPPSSVQPLPLSPHSICSTSTTTSTMSPYPSHYSAAACTDDDSSWLGSDSFSLFSSASGLLPPSSPNSLRSHRQTSASSTNSAVTSPCLSSLSAHSLSPSLPPLFCDKSADMPLPSVLSPFIAGRPPPGFVSSRASALWPLSHPQQHQRDEELRRRWQEEADDDEAVLHAACSEYNYEPHQRQRQQQWQPQEKQHEQRPQQQQQQQQWAEDTTGWYAGLPPPAGWSIGSLR